ncbi:MAG: IclR family transcriptional regulator [Candidatus Accumulibacter sp.]|nr:IclR family transcriptional regulator [Accumulibacter sp.]MBA4093002.1 IclR family transcriptional regulator [Accumulibacter sp.]
MRQKAAARAEPGDKDSRDDLEGGDGKHGVQSMEIGTRILQAIVNGHRSMMLKDIAAAADMPASKVHRYLVSLIRGGLVEQDPLTSRYDLGPFALNIGLVAIDRLDRIRLGIGAIANLRDEINETTALAVWSDKGPVIVRWERPRRPITVNVVTGTALEMITSASGRVFGAWLPRETVEPLVQKELKNPDLPEAWNTRFKVDCLFEEARRQGIATVSGYHLVPGVEAVAAPVFNFKNEISLAMLVVGVQGMFDMSPSGRVVTALKAAAADLSARLGHEGGPAAK